MLPSHYTTDSFHCSTNLWRSVHGSCTVAYTRAFRTANKTTGFSSLTKCIHCICKLWSLVKVK